jgi:heme/copper-type cytochrome/quinol oxidase subunit 2
MLTSIEYKFRTLEELNNLIPKINDFSLIEIIFMILIIITVIILVLFLIPSLNVYFNMVKKAKEIENKKIALKQIIIQKEIEENVQREVENENLKKS